MKKVLVLGAGLYNVTTIKKLILGGFYVIAVDKNPNSEGKKIAHEFYSIDVIDQGALLKLAKLKKIDGVMNVNEFGSRSAGYISNMMNLQGHSFKTIEATNDKGLMREIWSENNLSSPKHIVFKKGDEINDLVGEIGFPCVLKPTDSGGSGRGISIIKSPKDINEAYDFAYSYARNGRFIIEEYIEGIEFTIETFTINCKTYFLTMSDKVKPNLKTRVATSLNYPANIKKEVKIKVENLVSAALQKLEIKNGIAHTEIIIDKNNTPYLIETGARGGGGHIFHTIIEEVTGINAPVLQAKWLTNQPLSISKIKNRGCCYRFFNPQRGILKSVDNIKEAKSIKGVLDLCIVKKIGDEVGNLQNSLHRAGYVVTNGANREKAIGVADEVENTIIFNLESKDEY